MRIFVCLISNIGLLCAAQELNIFNPPTVQIDQDNKQTVQVNPDNKHMQLDADNKHNIKVSLGGPSGICAGQYGNNLIACVLMCSSHNRVEYLRKLSPAARARFLRDLTIAEHRDLIADLSEEQWQDVLNSCSCREQNYPATLEEQQQLIDAITKGPVHTWYIYLISTMQAAWNSTSWPWSESTVAEQQEKQQEQELKFRELKKKIFVCS